jgi:hypothetical protein
MCTVQLGKDCSVKSGQEDQAKLDNSRAFELSVEKLRVYQTDK